MPGREGNKEAPNPDHGTSQGVPIEGAVTILSLMVVANHQLV